MAFRERVSAISRSFARLYIGAFPLEYRSSGSPFDFALTVRILPPLPRDPDTPIAGVGALRDGALLYEVSGEPLSDTFSD